MELRSADRPVVPTLLNVLVIKDSCLTSTRSPAPRSSRYDVNYKRCGLAIFQATVCAHACDVQFLWLDVVTFTLTRVQVKHASRTTSI